MPRWEADGRSRLESAALELFLEAGYESTTVAAITSRAGLTERSFYRHFADKREVLFAGGDVLTEHLVAAVTSAPPDVEPYEALLAALSTGDEVFLPRQEVRRRAEAISRSDALAERELIKLAHLAGALAGALCARGVEDAQARLITDLGMSVFRIASADRLLTETPFAELVRLAVEQQRLVVLAGPTPTERPDPQHDGSTPP